MLKRNSRVPRCHENNELNEKKRQQVGDSTTDALRIVICLNG